MRRKYVWSALVVGLVVGALALAGGSAANPQAAYKVAWIYPGPHNDHGWSQAHDAGRLYVQKMLGSKVQTTYKENIFSNAQVPQVVAGLVRQGYNMIFATSFGMLENGVNGQLWKKYPNVKFEQATGTEIQKNQSEYFGAAEDTIYLSGMAAGAASKKGEIGYIVPFGTPEVVRHLNAFTLGAQATHPGAKVKIIWTTAWYSPPKETAAATNLIASGVDVVGQNVDSDAAGVYAEKKGIPWVGYDSNAQSLGAEAVADGVGLQLGPLLPEAHQGGAERHVEARLLLRLDQRRLHEARAVRAEGEREDEEADRGEAEGDPVGQVQRLPGAAVRPERQAHGPEGARSLKVLQDLYTMQWLVKGVREPSRRCRPRSPVAEGQPVGAVSERGVGSAGASPVPAVRMVGISKRFPGVVANDGVDFEAAAGEVHALLGENGAGKTTLSNILTGLYRPDEGSIELYGEPASFQSPRDALDAGICMVHQHFRLVEPFSVAENVVLGDHRGEGRRFLVHPGAIERRVRELGERYGLAVEPRARIWQLSVGEQQRVEILKALYREARILIMDEPTAVLTPQEAKALFVTLRAMADAGKTVIFISHKLHEVKAVADRVTVLRGGRTVETVEAADATPRSLASLMVGRELAEARPRDEPRALSDVMTLEVAGLIVPGDRGEDGGEGRHVLDPGGRDRRRRRRRGERSARARGGALGDAWTRERQHRGRRPPPARRRSAGRDPGGRGARARGPARDRPRPEPERDEQRRHEDVPDALLLARPAPRSSADARRRARGSSSATT